MNLESIKLEPAWAIKNRVELDTEQRLEIEMKS